jgi:hypothetical protein
MNSPLENRKVRLRGLANRGIHLADRASAHPITCSL